MVSYQLHECLTYFYKLMCSTMTKAVFADEDCVKQSKIKCFLPVMLFNNNNNDNNNNNNNNNKHNCTGLPHQF